MIIFFVAAILRVLPLFWSAEVFDVTLYRHQAISVLDHINPYLYTISPAFSTLREPYVYLPFSMFYAPLCLLISQALQISFPVVIKWTPIVFDLGILTALYFFMVPHGLRNAVKIAWLYALSPIAILIASFHGNIMSVPTFLTLLSFLFFVEAEKDDRRSRPASLRLSALFLGLAIAWRTYPVLLLPAFLLKSENRRTAAYFLFFVSLPILITSLPFLLASPIPLLKSLAYTGVNGLIGWHSIPLTASGSLLLHTPFFSSVRDLGILLTNHTHQWDKPVFFLVYSFALFKFHKRRSLLDLIVLIFLLAYFFLTSIAQQYFIWILPFLILWSFRDALVYTVLGSFALLSVYWSIYPEILFGRFPVIRPSIPLEYWLAFLTVFSFWLFMGGLLVKMIRRKEDGSPSKKNNQTVFLASTQFKQWIERGVYLLIFTITFFQIVFILRLDLPADWKLARTVPVHTAQEKVAGGQIIRNMPMPRVALYENGFLWFDPIDRSVKILDGEGSLRSEFYLKHPETGEKLEAYSIGVDPSDHTILASDLQRRFLWRFDKNGRCLARVAAEEVKGPSSVAVASNGDIAVVDLTSNAVKVLNSQGTVLREYKHYFKNGTDSPQSFDIGFDGKGSVYLLDGVEGKIFVFDGIGDQPRTFPVRIFSPLVQLAVSSEGFLSVLNIKTTQIAFYTLGGRYVAKLDNGSDKGTRPKLGKPCAVLPAEKNAVWIADAWKFEMLLAEFNKKNL